MNKLTKTESNEKKESNGKLNSAIDEIDVSFSLQLFLKFQQHGYRNTKLYQICQFLFSSFTCISASTNTEIASLLI